MRKWVLFLTPQLIIYLASGALGLSALLMCGMFELGRLYCAFILVAKRNNLWGEWK